jgi:EmrB/QacA subfamily drug resistance transporter
MTQTSPTTESSTSSPWPTFVVTAIAAYISTLDLSIVNVAFAEIAKDFPTASRGTISWVVTAYSIFFGSLLVVSGRLADRVGRKRLFQFGTMLFLVGSLLCALASTMGVLIFGRAVQGIGGAIMTPASLGLLLSVFPLERRSQAVAWNGAIGALGVASGPTLGAFFISAFGWRSAFWINVPICLIAALLAAKYVKETPRTDSPRPDIGASIFVTLSVASLVWGISRAEEQSWTDSLVIYLLVAAVFFGAFVVRRTQKHPVPLMPPALFKVRSFSVANIATFLFGAAFAANILNNVLFLRIVWDYSVLEAGLYSALAPVIVAVTSFAIGRHISRIGFRTLLVGGPLLFAALVYAGSHLFNANPTPWSEWLPLMFVLGISIGLTFPTLSAATVNSLPATLFSLGGAINNTSRQIGSAVGVALLVTIQATSERLHGFQRGWYFIAVCSAAAGLVSLLLPRKDKAQASHSHASR